jgi:uncharacterized caspase-like protein
VRAHNAHSFGEDRVKIKRKSPDSVTVVLPRLYLLSIGVGRYENLTDKDQLKYPSEDAKAIAKVFKDMEKKLFREIHIRLIADNENIKPTRANIEDNLEFLHQASQHDVAILFLAGHGIRDNRGNYYFLPVNAEQNEDGNFKRSTLVKWLDIKDALDIPARVLAFVDTCHSGAFFKKGNVRSVDTNEIIRSLTEQGTIVFASSTGEEYSQESDRWSHGAFTLAILKGLKEGHANMYKDDKITMKELDTFVSEEVPRLTDSAQHPVTYAPDEYKDFTIWIVK